MRPIDLSQQDDATGTYAELLRRTPVQALLMSALLAVLFMLSATSARATAGIDVTVDDANAVIQPGDDIAYTVQAVNSSSNMTAASVAITVTTPAGVTFDQCAFAPPFTGTCNGLANGVAVALHETLPPTTTATITVRVKTTYSVAGNVVSSVVLGATDAFTQTAIMAGPASVETDVLLPNVQLTLDDGLLSTIPGADVTYQLAADNVGAGIARSARMTFTLPAHVSLVDVSDGGALQSPGGTVVEWPAFDIPGAVGAVRTVTVRVNNPVDAGATALNAQAALVHTGTPAGTSVTDSHVTEIVATSITARVWRDLDGNGVINGDEAGLLGARVRFTPNGGPTITRTTGITGVATLGGIPAGEYTVTVDETSIRSTFVKTRESDGITDGVISVTTVPGPTSSVGFGYAAPGAILDSRLVLDTNADGARDANEPGVPGVTISIREAGDDTQFDTADDAVLTTTTDSAGNYALDGLTPGRYRVQLDGATIPAGYHLVDEADQTVDGQAFLTLIDSQSAAGLDFFFATSDLQVSKVDESVNTTTGSLVPYRIAYSNTGPTAAQQVRISEVVPDNTRFDAATSTVGWTCDADGAAGDHCAYDVGALAMGASGSLYFSVVVTDGMPAHVNALTNTVQIADVASVAPDPTPLNNRAVVVSPVAAAPDLTIRQTDGGTRIEPGEWLTYTVTYANQGNQDASGVKIKQVVPPNTLFRAAGSTPGWDCADLSPEGTVCTFAVGTVPAASEHTLTFVLEIAASMPVNVLTIDAEVIITDDTGFNASDGELTPVDSAPDLVLEQDISDQPVEPGGIIHFRLNYSNHGNQDAIGVLLVATVPQYTTFYAVESGLGWACQDAGQAGDNCVFVIGGLDAFASGEAVFAVRVDPTLPPNINSIANKAVIAGSGIEQDILNNETSGSAPVTRPTAVDLVSFTVTPGDDGILLRWRTSAERNSWGFLIHRSTDRSWENGQDITRLVIESVGNESSGSTYEFLDSTAVPGVSYYYWLQELEWTGATSIYGPIIGKIPGDDPENPGVDPEEPGSGEPNPARPTKVFIPVVATQR